MSTQDQSLGQLRDSEPVLRPAGYSLHHLDTEMAVGIRSLHNHDRALPYFAESFHG